MNGKERIVSNIAMKREAVAIASGNAVFSCSYSGHVTALARRPGEVLSLTVYKQRLLDCGRYGGIRDTLAGSIVAGKGAMWRRIASHRRIPVLDDCPVEDQLYSAMETEDEEFFGIYKLEDSGKPHIKYRRNGKTNMLYGWFLLVDAGDYYYYGDEKTDDDYIRFSDNFEETLGSGSKHLPATAFTSLGDIYYYSTPLKIVKGIRCGYNQGWTDVFKLRSELADDYRELSEIQYEHREAADKKFRHIMKQLRLRIPAQYFTSDERSLKPVERYITDNAGISALAFADGILLAGCRDGRLIVPPDGTAVHQFSQPVNAMCTMPEETVDGIREKIVRNIQMRALHAKPGRAAISKAA